MSAGSVLGQKELGWGAGVLQLKQKERRLQTPAGTVAPMSRSSSPSSPTATGLLCQESSRSKVGNQAVSVFLWLTICCTKKRKKIFLPMLKASFEENAKISASSAGFFGGGEVTLLACVGT